MMFHFTKLFPRHHLRAWRKKAGLSQELLADRVECCTSTTWRIENRHQGLSQNILERLAKVLGCSRGAIWDRDPDDE
jgi:transcriptional regulator with XRE-family HTH domain